VGKNYQKNSLEECVFVSWQSKYSVILSKIHSYRLLPSGKIIAILLSDLQLVNRLTVRDAIITTLGKQN